jgi:hypothetical protein
MKMVNGYSSENNLTFSDQTPQKAEYKGNILKNEL